MVSDEGTVEQLNDEDTIVMSAMRECPSCKIALTDDFVACPNDGTPLSAPSAGGEELRGRYEFIELVGRGGMSVIYKARHRLMGNIVAVKMLQNRTGSTERILKRFQQEAKASSKLSHPNIVGINDFGIVDQGQAFMVMPFVDGVSLSEMIKNGGPLSAEKAMPLFLQVTDALAHAHEMNVLHRDIKPSNIMVSSKGEAKVVDFGIAKIVDPNDDSPNLTVTGQVFGSPLYMSPEQCTGMKLDARSDIYSMGCLMYETLTGRAPMTGDNSMHIMFKHLHEDVPAFQEIHPEHSSTPQLEEIVRRCLMKDPERRFQTMRELQQALETGVLKKLPLAVRIGKVPSWALMSAVLAMICVLSVATVMIVTKPVVNGGAGGLSGGGGGDKDAGMDIANLGHTEMEPGTSGVVDIESAADVKEGEFKVDHPETFTDDQAQDFFSDIKGFKDFKEFTVLQLGKTKLTDRAIASLPKSATELSLAYTVVTDKGVSQLGRMSNLHLLNLKQTKTTDAGVQSLSNLPYLTTLILDETRCTGAGLATLNNKLSVRKISLIGTAYSDHHSSALKGFNNLHTLLLSVTDAGDDTMKVVSGIAPLQVLDMSDTQITDAGLRKVLNLANLKELHIMNCLKLTDGAIREAMRQMPKCHIWQDRFNRGTPALRQTEIHSN